MLEFSNDHRGERARAVARAEFDTANRVLQACIGRHNAIAKTFDSFGSTHALEDAPGKNLLVLADSRPDPNPKFSRAGVESLLSISGQDTMNINPKFGKHYDVQLNCKIMILANNLPEFNDASGALLARFLFLRTRKPFSGKEDSELLGKLLKERNQITWWFLRGLRRLMTNGRYTEPDNNLREQFEFKNNPIPSFVRLHCKITGDADDKIRPDELFRAFEAWSITNEVAPMTDNMFFRQLYTHFPNVGRTNTYVRGVRLADDEPTDGQLLDNHLLTAA